MIVAAETVAKVAGQVVAAAAAVGMTEAVGHTAASEEGPVAMHIETSHYPCPSFPQPSSMSDVPALK